jgi:hypothetical protein
MTTEFNRHDLLLKGMAGTAFGTAALVVPGLARADAPAGDPESVQVGEIYQLQAAFHRAKTLAGLPPNPSAGLALMMSLWADDATFTNHSSNGTTTTYTNFTDPSLTSFWQNSGSFTHTRFSLVPSFKTTIQVHGNEAFLYFECHDVQSYADPNARSIVNDTYLAGTLRNNAGNWQFFNMTAGPSSPLSYDTYYFPIPS